MLRKKEYKRRVRNSNGSAFVRSTYIPAEWKQCVGDPFPLHYILYTWWMWMVLTLKVARGFGWEKSENGGVEMYFFLFLFPISLVRSEGKKRKKVFKIHFPFSHRKFYSRLLPVVVSWNFFVCIYTLDMLFRQQRGKK